VTGLEHILSLARNFADEAACAIIPPEFREARVPPPAPRLPDRRERAIISDKPRR